MVLDQSMYQSIQNSSSPGVFSVAASVPAIATVAAATTPAIAAIPHCWCHFHCRSLPIVVAISVTYYHAPCLTPIRTVIFLSHSLVQNWSSDTLAIEKLD